MYQGFLYVCGAGAVAVLFLALRETWRWRQGKSLVSGRQLLIRWTSALILVALIVLILQGSMHKDIREFAHGWLVVLGLITLLVLIALVDLYEVAKTQQGKRKQLLKDLRETMDETFRHGKPPGSQGSKGQG